MFGTLSALCQIKDLPLIRLQNKSSDPPRSQLHCLHSSLIFCGKLKKPGLHLSQLLPKIVGLHLHCPVTWSQLFCPEAAPLAEQLQPNVLIRINKKAVHTFIKQINEKQALIYSKYNKNEIFFKISKSSSNVSECLYLPAYASLIYILYYLYMKLQFKEIKHT